MFIEIGEIPKMQLVTFDFPWASLVKWLKLGGAMYCKNIDLTTPSHMIDGNELDAHN